MEVIRTTGSACERGYQHGKAFAKKARECLEYWLALGKLDVNESATSDRLDSIERNLKRFAPTLLEELNGISAGSGIPFRDTLLLNSVTELGPLEEIVCCTNVIMADTPHGVIHAYNHDHFPDLVARVLVGEVAQLENGIRVSRVVWAGTVWTIAGVNSSALTQGLSGIWTTDTNWSDGIPSHMLLRLLLERCTNVEEAITLLDELTPIAHGFNFAFADDIGDAAIVEKSPTRQAVRRLDGKALCCTNTFLSESMQGVLNADKVELLSNARNRLESFERLTGDGEVSWDLHGLQEIMRYHSGQGSICMHAAAGDLKGLHSAHSFLMMPVDRRMFVTEGPPCQFPYLPLGGWLL